MLVDKDGMNSYILNRFAEPGIWLTFALAVQYEKLDSNESRFCIF